MKLVFDWLLILNAALLTGISCLIFAEYHFNAKIRHIAMVALSHVILTILVTCSIVWHVFISKYGSLATGAAICSFILSDYSVLWMLRYGRNRR